MNKTKIKKHTRKKRVIKIDIEITTLKTYSSFRKEFPDFKYDIKTKTYRLPKRIERDIILPKVKIKKVKEPTTIIIKKEREITKVPRERYRKQLVKSYRSDYPPYVVYAKSLTINPIYDLSDLRKAINMAILHFHRLTNYNLQELNLEEDYDGVEKPTLLGSGEDLLLNDYAVHTEIFVKLKDKEILYRDGQLYEYTISRKKKKALI